MHKVAITGYIPNLESGTAKNWQFWEQSLECLEALNPAGIMPGHGEFLQGENIARELERMRHFLRAARQTGLPPTLVY